MGKIKKMEQELIDLKEQREKLIQEITLDAVAKDAAIKEYYKKRSEKQDQICELDKKISEIESATKLISMSYTDNIFIYNGETHIIKKERIENIKADYECVCINYKPVGTTRVNTITIQTGSKEQTDIAYKNIRKTLLGV